MEQKLPNRIKELRDGKYLSLRDLVELTNITRSKLQRLENGTTPLVFDDAKRISAALGVPLSALLNDEDVELRLDENGTALIQAVQDIAAPDRADVVRAAREIVKVARVMAAQKSTLKGDELLVGELAETWNGFQEGERTQALQLWKIARLGRHA